MTNFETAEERYFAACILDSLIYRSRDQTIALMDHLFQRTLVDPARVDLPPIGAVPDWRDVLLSDPLGEDPGVRLVPAIGRNDSTTKSAYAIARLLRRHLAIRREWIIRADEIPAMTRRGIRTFVFVDDFLGTGDQFGQFIRDHVEQHLSDIYAVYAPLVAHAQGIEQLHEEFPSLRVRAVEVLDASYGVFHSSSRWFDDGVNTPDVAKQFYYDLLRAKNIPLSGPDRRGYGHLELTYVFEHGTPDNSLPILWWRNTKGFTPLFER